MSTKEVINKYLGESEDGVMAYTTAHPHGGEGRRGYNKGLKCPHCGAVVDFKKLLNKHKEKMGVDEATTTPTKMKCMECGKDFKKKIGSKTYEVKCPKCGSYDTEPV